LSEKARQACHDLAEIGRRITFIPQREQLGFGHAVYCARDWVGNEPFLLLLGDHIFASNTERCCAGQLLDAFHAGGQCSVVAVYPAPAAEVCHYGTMAGTWLDDDQTLASVSDFVEKPSADLARQSLVTPGLPPDHFLCIYGQYVLTARIFEFLQRQIEADQRQAGEIQLTTALEALRREDGMLAYVMNGEHYDTGLPVNYLRSIVSYYERGQHRNSP
ncbi:MAG: UTP--glucose-1-phosphate uridylyltransferase, partial [Lentisphaerae bacterium]|nr:UTP--glucose-1-phosphate uridylyltransferase [Lentisphaerota bacterium]